MVVRKCLSITGPALFFVTTTVVDWLPIFAIDDIAQEITQQICETTAQFQVSVCAYVIMPSHMHALFGFREATKLSEFMKSLKRESARRIRDKLPVEFSARLFRDGGYSLWKARFDDIVVWSGQQFHINVEYIHNNPVRAGLVQKAEDYRHSSARQWLSDESGDISVEKKWSWTGS